MNKMINKNILKNKIVVCLLAVFCCLLWGSAFPFIKIGYRLFMIDASDSTSQILFAGARFFIAGILTIFFGSLLQKEALVPKRNSLKYVGIISVFQTILQYLFFYIGLAHASGVKASIINGMSTFFAILLACLLRKQEKLNAGKIIGSILGTIAVVIISTMGGTIDGTFSLVGEGFILLASASYAVSSVLMKEFSTRENPVTLSGYQFLLGGLVMMLTGFLTGGTIQTITGFGVLLLIYLALVSSVAYSIWSVLLKYNPVSSVAIYGFTTPIFGAFLSAVILEEYKNFNYKHFISLLLVSIGIYLVNKKEEA